MVFNPKLLLESPIQHALWMDARAAAGVVEAYNALSKQRLSCMACDDRNAAATPGDWSNVTAVEGARRTAQLHAHPSKTGQGGAPNPYACSLRLRMKAGTSRSSSS